MLCSSKGSVLTIQRQKRKAETMKAGMRVSVASMGILEAQANRDVEPVENARISLWHLHWRPSPNHPVCVPWCFKSLDRRKEKLFRDYFNHFFLELEIILISVTGKKHVCLKYSIQMTNLGGLDGHLCCVLSLDRNSHVRKGTVLLAPPWCFFFIFLRQYFSFFFRKVSFTTCLERHVVEDSLSLLI